MSAPAHAWHALSVEEAVRLCGTDAERGLSAEAARERRAREGPNELPLPERPGAARRLLHQLLNPLVVTLLAAAVLDVVVTVLQGERPSRRLADFADAIAILLIVAANAVFGFLQERRAERALDALRKMSAPRCRVRRGGVAAAIPSAELVPGDVVELTGGDEVPADVRIVDGAGMAAMEAALTGESVPVTKDARAVLPPDTPEADRANMLLMGTALVRGDARGVVVATGPRTRLGQIGRMITESTKPKSPLERRVEEFGRKILWICVGLSGALFLVGLRQGGRWDALLLTAVSLAVAAIPEGLPAITTITLALGMQRMARRSAIVRHLPAVETLGCVGVICSDKTGTLTRNEMTVRAVWAAGEELDVAGAAEVPEAARRAVEVGVVANKASLARGADGTRVLGDPTDGALLQMGVRLGLAREALLAGAETLLEVPFDSDRQRMTVVVRRGGRIAAHCKGALEKVLPLCAQVRTGEGVVPLDEARRGAILAAAERLSRRALRVLALAEREGGTEVLGPADASEAERAGRVERGMVFAGLVGMIDPPRPEVKAALDACRAAGIRAVMITGDHALTAEAIARDLGMWEEGDLAVTGSEIERMGEEDLRAVIRRVRVFARVAPEHKKRIVDAFQGGAIREVVAMTGDGVNDAPAIKAAAIGVAMGRSGADVAREASDMVLADDNFATIVDAVREGRAIFSNIRKSIFFLLSSNAGLCITVFVTSFFKDMPPLSPLQILWINLVTNGLPALALGMDPAEADQMRRPPRPPREPLLTLRDGLGILAVGVLMAASAVAIYRLPLWEGETVRETVHSKVTMVFTVLALAPLFHAFNCRSERASIFRLGALSNRWLVAAVLASAAGQLVALAVTPLQPLFRSDHHWTMAEALWVLGLSVLPIPVIEASKAILAGPLAGRKPSP